VISAVGHEIDWALSDYAADLRAPTPSAAAELVSANRREALDHVGRIKGLLDGGLRARLDRARLLIKPFGAADLEYRFRSILQPALVRFDDAREALLEALAGRCAEFRGRIRLVSAGLEAASPLAVLERGFAVAVNERNGRVLKNSADARPGDRLGIRLFKGRIGARAETIQAEEQLVEKQLVEE
jgi:exodeoxyribonuclease VII large subunit